MYAFYIKVFNGQYNLRSGRKRWVKCNVWAAWTDHACFYHSRTKLLREHHSWKYESNRYEIYSLHLLVLLYLLR
jgi:hypothetical protein